MISLRIAASEQDHDMDTSVPAFGSRSHQTIRLLFAIRERFDNVSGWVRPPWLF